MAAAHWDVHRTNAGNPFRSYTVIHVGYCSGDAHGGNVRQDFEGPGGSDVVQTATTTLLPSFVG